MKFTEKGEIIITVKVLEESDDELFLHFSVRDTGIGLSSDAIEKLFQSFQQADSSTSRKYGGSGLGLSISKQLATLMNGEVGVESELGKGSLFWFTARLKKAVKKARNTTSHVNSLKGRRVLVVDDNEIARYELENMLSNIGLSVTQVSKGTTALKYIRMAEKVGEPYEIIFLDWYMPEMDGAETAKAIHALNLKFQPHLVMVTAHGREEVLKEMEVAGLEDVFIKPVNASLLFDSVMRLLSNSHDHHVDTEKEAVDDYDLSNLINELKIIYGTSILVVEDNELNQEVALGLLSDEGFHVDIANDGKEAIYMINNKYYDIVLMDMQMPVMDGVSATIEIRKDPKFTHLPIVAMTANAMPQDKENCKNAGMNDYISKPIDPEELFRALLKWIRPTLKEELKELKNDFSISEPLPINDLPIIEGLDMQLGMQRVLGKKTLYLNMLKNYVRGQESVPASLVDALNNSDFEAAQRLAHTAKSVNGNIGAMSLHDIAAHIETMIAQQASREEINEALVHFEILQTQMIEALKSALSTPQREEIPQHWEVEDINATVNQLNMLLQDDDMAALTFLNEHSALLTFALGVEVFTNLAHLVRNVDFEQACALIEQVKQSV